MSSIASATILPIPVLQELQDASIPSKSFFGKPKDKFTSVLETHRTANIDYPWSGYVLATLVCFLDGQGISFKSEYQDIELALEKARGVSYLILTNAHREQCQGPLEASTFSNDQLRDFYEAFNATQAPGVEMAMSEGIQFLLSALKAVSPSHVALVALA